MRARDLPARADGPQPVRARQSARGDSSADRAHRPAHPQTARQPDPGTGQPPPCKNRHTYPKRGPTPPPNTRCQWPAPVFVRGLCWCGGLSPCLGCSCWRRGPGLECAVPGGAEAEADGKISLGRFPQDPGWRPPRRPPPPTAARLPPSNRPGRLTWPTRMPPHPHQDPTSPRRTGHGGAPIWLGGLSSAAPWRPGGPRACLYAHGTRRVFRYVAS